MMQCVSGSKRKEKRTGFLQVHDSISFYLSPCGDVFVFGVKHMGYKYNVASTICKGHQRLIICQEQMSVISLASCKKMAIMCPDNDVFCHKNRILSSFVINLFQPTLLHKLGMAFNFLIQK